MVVCDKNKFHSTTPKVPYLEDLLKRHIQWKIRRIILKLFETPNEKVNTVNFRCYLLQNYWSTSNVGTTSNLLGIEFIEIINLQNFYNLKKWHEFCLIDLINEPIQ